MNADPKQIKLALESDAGLREEWNKVRLDAKLIQDAPETQQSKKI